ncbi:hypothetical protein DVH24_022017 [Malus domestica]|uniref:KOW domain-containing protein n=1 Tax=Malus domestica TaxID=3750 RepID=A0A498IXA6_MALDO|nr:hypothetical protein DVH24_022017 [Malus domestica]
MEDHRERAASDFGLGSSEGEAAVVGGARGLKKHLKRLNAPKHWMLDKLGGAFAPKPSSGPHKSRECLPLVIILRNRLKYALTYREVISILMQRHVLVDGKVRTDKTYPSGFMDVVSIPKTNENFRLLYDTKGRFRLHSIRDEEAKFKLCKVRSVQFGQKGIPYINTYDGRTIRYPDPLIKANDTIKLDLETNKITDFIKFDVGNVVMVTGGRNRGRVGVIKNREKHKGSFETIHVQDASGHEFATRLGNVFTIGKGTKPWISLPKVVLRWPAPVIQHRLRLVALGIDKGDTSECNLRLVAFVDTSDCDLCEKWCKQGKQCWAVRVIEKGLNTNSTLFELDLEIPAATSNNETYN